MKLHVGDTIEVNGREACVTGCNRWGGTGGPTPGSELGPGALVYAVDESGPVLARLTPDGWAEVHA